MRQHDERHLRAALREEADRHRPDREAMLDRIAEGRAAYAHRPANRAFALLRPAAAALAVAVVLVLAVAGVRLGNRGPDEDAQPVAAPSPAPATSAPAPAGTPKPSPPATSPTAPRAPRTSTGASSSPATVTPSRPGTDTDRDGYVSSTGRLDPNTADGWTEDSVVLESARKLTALDVTVEVALTAGVTETGRWSTVSPDLLMITSSRTTKMLVFHFTLRSGATLAPGTYTFAAQFSHAAGKRSVADDSYAAKVTGGGKDAKVSGGFLPQR
ncbi:hypothetical protein Ani05nite_39630 [Amorphoplanes nipponensis]|uniref:Uncharacterized protein n=1 Tax=Actinoplanes nipponensis TaxID=135950 RepID=A0A919JG70_9ACTN|nr:hypothetical protein [Actinoplanes nipponensis]GIE50429.1 hypothetical protein Ani05nite_39630 [Actinoplanes nipponensis]